MCLLSSVRSPLLVVDLLRLKTNYVYDGWQDLVVTATRKILFTERNNAKQTDRLFES